MQSTKGKKNEEVGEAKPVVTRLELSGALPVPKSGDELLELVVDHSTTARSMNLQELLDKSPKLRIFKIRGCQQVRFLSLRKCTRLETVSVSDMPTLTSLILSSSAPLSSLEVEGCPMLRTLSAERERGSTTGEYWTEKRLVLRNLPQLTWAQVFHLSNRAYAHRELDEHLQPKLQDFMQGREHLFNGQTGLETLYTPQAPYDGLKLDVHNALVAELEAKSHTQALSTLEASTGAGAEMEAGNFPLPTQPTHSQKSTPEAEASAALDVARATRGQLDPGSALYLFQDQFDVGLKAAQFQFESNAPGGSSTTHSTTAASASAATSLPRTDADPSSSKAPLLSHTVHAMPSTSIGQISQWEPISKLAPTVTLLNDDSCVGLQQVLCEATHMDQLDGLDDPEGAQAPSRPQSFGDDIARAVSLATLELLNEPSAFNGALHEFQALVLTLAQDAGKSNRSADVVNTLETTNQSYKRPIGQMLAELLMKILPSTDTDPEPGQPGFALDSDRCAILTIAKTLHIVKTFIAARGRLSTTSAHRMLNDDAPTNQQVDAHDDADVDDAERGVQYDGCYAIGTEPSWPRSSHSVLTPVLPHQARLIVPKLPTPLDSSLVPKASNIQPVSHYAPQTAALQLAHMFPMLPLRVISFREASRINFAAFLRRLPEADSAPDFRLNEQPSEERDYLLHASELSKSADPEVWLDPRNTAALLDVLSQSLLIEHILYAGNVLHSQLDHDRPSIVEAIDLRGTLPFSYRDLRLVAAPSTRYLDISNTKMQTEAMEILFGNMNGVRRWDNLRILRVGDNVPASLALYRGLYGSLVGSRQRQAVSLHELELAVPSLRALDLGGTDFGGCHRIPTVVWTDAHVQLNMEEAALAVIIAQPTLKSLGLRDCAFTSNDSLLRVIKAACDLTPAGTLALEHLDLGNLSPSEASVHPGFLELLARRAPNLRSLLLDSTQCSPYASDGALDSVTAISQMKVLRTLDLSGRTDLFNIEGENFPIHPLARLVNADLSLPTPSSLSLRALRRRALGRLGPIACMSVALPLESDSRQQGMTSESDPRGSLRILDLDASCPSSQFICKSLSILHYVETQKAEASALDPSTSQPGSADPVVAVLDGKAQCGPATSPTVTQTFQIDFATPPLELEEKQLEASTAPAGGLSNSFDFDVQHNIDPISLAAVGLERMPSLARRSSVLEQNYNSASSMVITRQCLTLEELPHEAEGDLFLSWQGGIQGSLANLRWLSLARTHLCACECRLLAMLSDLEVLVLNDNPIGQVKQTPQTSLALPDDLAEHTKPRSPLRASCVKHGYTLDTPEPCTLVDHNVRRARDTLQNLMYVCSAEETAADPLAFLSSLKSLRKLELDRSYLSGPFAMRRLARSSVSLEVLSLNGNRFSINDLWVFVRHAAINLTRLRALCMIDAVHRATAESLTSVHLNVAGLRSLRELAFPRYILTPDILKQLANMQAIERIELLGEHPPGGSKGLNSGLTFTQYNSALEVRLAAAYVRLAVSLSRKGRSRSRRPVFLVLTRTPTGSQGTTLVQSQAELELYNELNELPSVVFTSSGY